MPKNQNIENNKSFIFDSSNANSLNSTHCALCETIGQNSHLILSESNEILHLKARELYLLYIFSTLELDN